MRLYKTTYVAPGEGVTRINWSGTQADAREDRKELKSSGYDDIETEEVDVPTSKAELLEFLNENCAIVPGERQAGTKGQRPGQSKKKK